MTLYEKLRERKANLKTRIALIKANNKSKTTELNYKRIGL